MFVAIDPGTAQSAWVMFVENEPAPISYMIEENESVLERLGTWRLKGAAIEMVASYGMAVGKDVFETVRWIGRFEQRIRDHNKIEPAMVYRKDVKLHLCGVTRAKDLNIRQALIDMYGPGKEAAVGLKDNKGPLYGMKKDMWSALAVGVTHLGITEKHVRAQP